MNANVCGRILIFHFVENNFEIRKNDWKCSKIVVSTSYLSTYLLNVNFAFDCGLSDWHNFFEWVVSKNTYNDKSQLVDVVAFLRGLPILKIFNGIFAFVSRVKVASISSYDKEKIKIKWDWYASNQTNLTQNMNVRKG